MSQETINTLILGSGGREHALGWKISKSPLVEKQFFSPGNGGTASLGTNIVLPTVAEVVEFTQNENIGLTVVGPEDLLAEGIVDALNKEDKRAFGPTKQATQIESKKAATIIFNKKHGIPQPDYVIAELPEDAIDKLDKLPWNYVIKKNGLAAGKGVYLPKNRDEAITAIQEIMVKKLHGNIDNQIVFQEKLTGRESSVMAFVDRNGNVVLMPAVQDHKRIFDNDKGPNTGGMGAYAPVPEWVLNSEELQEVKDKIIQPAVEGMIDEDRPFIGVLFAGIMKTNDGIKCLEFNARFGDPETQVIIPMLSEQTDLVRIMLNCIYGDLEDDEVIYKKGAAATVVAASEGYPSSNYENGFEITGLGTINDPNINVFHAGTAIEKNGKLVTSGGRILAVTGTGETIDKALENAYTGISQINFRGIHYRKDIGAQAAIE